MDMAPRASRVDSPVRLMRRWFVLHHRTHNSHTWAPVTQDTMSVGRRPRIAWLGRAVERADHCENAVEGAPERTAMMGRPHHRGHGADAARCRQPAH